MSGGLQELKARDIYVVVPVYWYRSIVWSRDFSLFLANLVCSLDCLVL